MGKLAPIEWKEIEGFGGRYLVSNYGGVYCKQLKKLRRRHADRYGYLFVSLKQGARYRNFWVARLVCEAFLGKSELHVNHKDGNKTRNYLHNLEYVSRSENLQHASKTGLLRPSKGEKNANASLTENDVKKIRRLLKQGLIQRAIAEMFGVGRSAIAAIKQNRTWRHVPNE